MKVYLAAPWSRKAEVEEIATQFRAQEIEVSSRWHSEENPLEAYDDGDPIQEARKDLDAINEAFVLVALNFADWRTEGRGGRHVEFGYAVATHRPILLVGERTHVFCWLATDLVPTIEQALVWCRGYRAGWTHYRGS